MAKINNSRNANASYTPNREKSAEYYRDGMYQLSRRRFADALDLFEEAAKTDRRNPDVYPKMGITCLYLNYLEDAEHYFTRALQLDRDNSEAMNGMAFINLRRDNTAEATDLICDVLRIDPQNKYAGRVFESLKVAENIEAYTASIHPKDFVALPGRFSLSGDSGVPKMLRYFAYSIIIISLVVLAVIIFRGPRLRIPWGKSKKGRTYLYPSSIPAGSDLGKSFRSALNASYDRSQLVLADGEASAVITRIKMLIQNREYNESIYLYNKIMASHADKMNRSLALQLSRFFESPSYKKLHFNPVASDILRHPYYYKNVTVKWLTRVVMVTNRVFMQVAPARFHNGKNANVRVVVIARDLPRLQRGRSVEVFGEVKAVDRNASGKKGIIFITLKKLVKLH